MAARPRSGSEAMVFLAIRKKEFQPQASIHIPARTAREQVLNLAGVIATEHKSVPPPSFHCTSIHIEQTYVLDGSLEDEQGAATAGNFVWRPGGNTHLARAPNGCVSISFFTKLNRFFDDVPWFTELGKE